MDEAVFFSQLRKTGLFRTLTNAQVSGIQRIISAWDAYGYGLDTGCCYALACSYHETGKRMQPVREAFGTSTADTIRKLDAAWKKGQMKWVKTNYWKAGWFGRGDVQITHENNYSGPLRNLALKLFEVDIHANPDAVLRGDVSAYLMIEGITRGLSTKSDFTKNALETYINSTKTDYNGARATVNPNEKDSYKPIGDIARKFEIAMRAGKAAAGVPFLGEGSPMRKPRISVSSAKPKLVEDEPPRRAPPFPPAATIEVLGGGNGGRGGGSAPSATVTNVAKRDDGVAIETEAVVPGADAIEVPVPTKATTIASREGIYDGEYHKELEVVQVMLQAKGYYLLATPNGKWGPKVASAVLAFRRENDLPLVDEIDDQFIVSLVKADRRSVSDDRAQAEVSDVKDRAPIKDALTLDKVGKWIMGLGIFGGVGKTGFDLTETKETLLSFNGLMTSLKAALPFLIVVAVGVGVFFIARRLIRTYLKTYREGGLA